MLGSDPKTTLGGILLAVGLVGMKASTFGLPLWADFLGALLAAVGGGFLGKSAVDSNKAGS